MVRVFWQASLAERIFFRNRSWLQRIRQERQKAAFHSGVLFRAAVIMRAGKLRFLDSRRFLCGNHRPSEIGVRTSKFGKSMMRVFSVLISRLLPAVLLLMPAAMAADLPNADALQQLGLELRWTSQAVLNITRDIVTHTVNDEDVFYVQTSGGMLTAFHAENGRKLWANQVGRGDEPAMAAVSNKDIVLVVAGPVAYGYNKFTGKETFAFRLPLQPTASPAIDEAAFYIPLTGGALYCYSITRLEYLHRYGSLPDDAATAHSWRFICQEAIDFPPVVGDMSVAFTTAAGNVHVVQTRGNFVGRTGALVAMPKRVTAPLAIGLNRASLDEKRSTYSAIILTGDNRISSMDMVRGSADWAYPIGHRLSKQPLIVGSHLFVVTEDSTLMKFSRDPLSVTWGRPEEIPDFRAPGGLGLGIEEVSVDPPVDEVSNGLLVKEITPQSPADMAGVQLGDVVIRIDGLTFSGIEEALKIISDLPFRIQRPLDVVRRGERITLKMKIDVRKWDVSGVQNLTASGRFGVYGLDQTNRFVAIDQQTATLRGRLSVQGYTVQHSNSATDLIYLVSTDGEVACLREIGPTVTMPEFSPASRFATVTAIKVKPGDAAESGTSVVCEVSLADGSTQPILATADGVIRTVYVRPGDKIEIGQPVALISDDSFATYHQRPQQRPVDVQLGSPAP